MSRRSRGSVQQAMHENRSFNLYRSALHIMALDTTPPGSIVEALPIYPRGA
jgi:hypothetical protein